MRPPTEKVKGIKEKSEEMNYGQVEREVCKNAVVTNSQVLSFIGCSGVCIFLFLWLFWERGQKTN